MRNKTADMKEYKRIWTKNNKDKVKAYYQKNKEKYKEKSLEYYEKNKEQRKEYRRNYYAKLKQDKNKYLVYDDKGTLIFTFTRKEIINKLGIKNKQFDFALASGTEINGFYFDVEII